MMTQRSRLMILLSALVVGLPMPYGTASAQGITVSAFSGGGDEVYGLSNQLKIRRGRTSRVTIVKDFINLVDFGSISISGGPATISRLSNGTTRVGGRYVGSVDRDGTASARLRAYPKDHPFARIQATAEKDTGAVNGPPVPRAVIAQPSRAAC
jgi:hypothetical protein